MFKINDFVVDTVDGFIYRVNGYVGEDLISVIDANGVNRRVYQGFLKRIHSNEKIEMKIIKKWVLK